MYPPYHADLEREWMKKTRCLLAAFLGIAMVISEIKYPSTTHAFALSSSPATSESCGENDPHALSAPGILSSSVDNADQCINENETAAETFASPAEPPALTYVQLSPETASLEDVARIQALSSHPIVDYPLELYGKQVSTADEILDFNHIRIGDNGKALRELLPYFTNCKRIELEDCGLKNRVLGALQQDYPDIQIVWRIHFGCYSVLTDETRILASIKGKELTGEMCSVLKYCTKVRYLDLGHNIINDISFVQYMPDLEVAILAINYWSDASPLANCKKLEYLEIFNTRCTDLSPLAALTNLKHLNICWIKELKDITPLYSLTGLERLWIGCVNKVPREQFDEIRKRLPDTKINTSTDNPTSEGWRKNPRYDLLVEQMGYNWKQPYSLPSGARK